MGLIHIPGITVLPCDQNFGFSWNMTQSQRKAAAPLYYDHLSTDGLEHGPAGLAGRNHMTCWCWMKPLEPAIWGLWTSPGDKGPSMKNRLSWRSSSQGAVPQEDLQEQADYITEMVMRRHPYERGIGAREGIEY